MRALSLIVRRFSQITAQIGGFFYQLTTWLNSLLPALLPQTELVRLIRVHYEDSYRHASTQYPKEVLDYGLEPWEEEVASRFMKTSGTVVVLGAGVGRESIALAQRGLRVIGLDINYEALHLASRTAQFKPVDVAFIQANFLELPLLPTQIDYLFLSGIMYSAVPGRKARQAWFRNLCTHLKTGGLALVNYYIDPAWRTGSPQRTPKLHPWLASLPGANAEYQPGDLLSNGHFLHTFLSEDELRSEFIETGATIVHLDWEKQFAVLAWSS